MENPVGWVTVLLSQVWRSVKPWGADFEVSNLEASTGNKSGLFLGPMKIPPANLLIPCPIG
jgi:hypothetical protein